MLVRPFQTRDAAHLGKVFYRSVREIGPARYSSAQVEVWAPAEPTEESKLRRAHDGRVFLVAVDDNDRPLAYGELKHDGHIDHLYCSPELTGTGLVITLYNQLERAAVDKGLRLLHTEASELARSFFLKQGFATVQRRDFILRNVPIHNYRMEKRFGP